RPPPCPTLFPYTTLFRSGFAPLKPLLSHEQRRLVGADAPLLRHGQGAGHLVPDGGHLPVRPLPVVAARRELRGHVDDPAAVDDEDRKSTRLNSSHVKISY